MNQRFRDGASSNDLAQAGVLLRQFDALDDPAKPWLPCPHTGPTAWCASLSDRWAASVVNTHARHLYLYDKGGLVLFDQPTLFCACPEDCNSQSKVCEKLYGDETCTPGCFPPEGHCTPGGRAYDCSFPPHQLADALRAQETTSSFAGRNNELVLDTRSVVHALPHSIDGFFFLSTMGDAGAEALARVRANFMARYRLTAADAPPLVRLSFGGDGGAIDGDAPFTLVER